MLKTVSKEIIAVDVDDVLALHVPEFVKHSNEVYGTNLTVEQYISDWATMWGVSKEEAVRRWKAWYMGGTIINFAAVDGADMGLTKLKKNYDLVVVTARNDDLKDVTHQWIDRHFPNTFADIRLVSLWEDPITTKAEACQDLGAAYLIDDYISNCDQAADAGVGAILFGDYAWNRVDKLPEGVTRVADWPDVVEYFDEAGR